MLNVTEMNRFYYLDNFYDVRVNMNGCYPSFTSS